MKRSAGFDFYGKLIILLLIGFIVIYLIYAMVKFGGGNAERQTESVEKIINKALLQCYALEGYYPTDLEYVQKYGVVFNNDKYIYWYEWFGDSFPPAVKVLEKFN